MIFLKSVDFRPIKIESEIENALTQFILMIERMKEDSIRKIGRDV